MPYTSLALTVMVPATPAVRGELSPTTTSRVAAAAVTTMSYLAPVMVLVTVSRARIPWASEVLKVTLKVWTPESAAVNL